ncbi:MAG: hypothetical protein IKR65_06950, partial [Selenomonadaceae bacterium]|nr:hypothetical protein [Selenomonadaceae bacterium]
FRNHDFPDCPHFGREVVRNCEEINFTESRRTNSPRQGRENEVVAELRRVFPDAVLADLDKRNVKVIYEQFLSRGFRV